ncbi:hypothetical protein SAMN04488128_103788 [Chitinophaga eiseniae]|uniref:Uncharacterized protein n=1 Tax=Chitinophaga eiseniae TaxID=634771 RepID=A0A1T4SYB0_9BACT|nr:hypothetical protein [Chitinophaga eiseniae]SKA33195.1 hypothetical protein SAMN04488128_103788 [Chitinophaga eiseniae]
MNNSENKRLYDSKEKQLKSLKRKGNIITFKNPIYPWGTSGESRNQIIVHSLQVFRDGAVRIIGNSYDTDWYADIDKLLDAIDWQWMEGAHQLVSS